MRKLLIISYHALPADIIASYRSNAYLRFLKNLNYEPTLLTHFLGMEERNEVCIEQNDYGKVIRIPIRSSRLGKITSYLETKKLLNKISIFVRWMMGFLDSNPDAINSYFSLKSHCISELDLKQYDLVLGIFSPHHHLRLCYNLHKRFGISYVLDFRDLWHNRIMAKHYSPTSLEKVNDTFSSLYWKKWLSKALFFTITSEPWKKRLSELTQTQGYVIMNGYESAKISASATYDDQFVILHAGSLYEHQQIEIFLEGARKFIQDYQVNDIKIKFIGGDRTGGLSGNKYGFMIEPVRRVRNFLEKSHCDITHRIDKSDILLEMSKSHLLLFFGHSKVSGWYSGKIFDYLAARRNILVVPNDNDVVEELIVNTQSGQIADTPEEVYNYLKSAYFEWRESGSLTYCGVEKELVKYSRESQISILGHLMNQYLD
ncbi:hypothetical protein [Ekhidna sp.]|uniref:hypothetical protein n=1 Tax=Ekhidna sp. TaxID=2608089 RepID=UPI0032986FEB